MKTCIFVGPTLFRVPTPPGISRYGPVAMGSVFRAAEAGYRRVGIVDGYFGNTPSVWHKEILYAISQGVEVVGAASMGALRAAELCQFGMVGIGRIFRMYRRGLWTDDDEVAVLHATAELGYCPLSDTMANIRFTLRRLRRMGFAPREVETELLSRLKARHFSKRTREEFGFEATALLGRQDAQSLMDDFEREYVDVKADDAHALLAYLSQPLIADQRQGPPAFLATGHWRGQFEKALKDVPPLR
ncbi:MAG TPA: TfuA domain-containing protein [Casimicrobiaceae bacterium]|nr:TfuA domain-containing protein [Casimicrobiaceae bacterium]